MKQLQQRSYQIKIHNNLINAIGEGHKSILIISPAGSGKTIMGFMALRYIYDNSDVVLGKPRNEIQFGWMAMRRNLLSQAKQENESITELQVPNVHYISMFDKNPPKVDVLIQDECHHTAASSAINIYTKTNPAINIGLTCTAFRSDGMHLSYSKTLTEAGYHNLIANGYLSQFNQYVLPQWDIDTVTKVYMDDPERWGKTIMFFLTIKEARKAAEIIAANGFSVNTIDSNSPDKVRILEDFENGKYDVLTNVYILSEGFNMPELKTAFVRDGSKGPTIQMAGRVLRVHPDIPYANIVQSMNTKWLFIKTATPKSRYVLKDGIWKSVGSNKLVNTMYKQMIKKIINTDIQLPEFITKQKRRKKYANFQPTRN